MSQNFQNGYVSIEASVDSPRILLDSANSIFLIEGPSYPEDAYEVYECVLQWLKQYNYIFKNQLNCQFKFKVLSSASRKMILEILLELEKSSRNNKNVRIQWYFEKYDEDMMEAGEDFSDNIDIPFEFISI